MKDLKIFYNPYKNKLIIIDLNEVRLDVENILVFCELMFTYEYIGEL